ncbi:hypothetical protein ACAX46_004356 [Providencia rettgeri]
MRGIGSTPPPSPFSYSQGSENSRASSASSSTMSSHVNAVAGTPSSQQELVPLDGRGFLLSAEPAALNEDPSQASNASNTSSFPQFESRSEMTSMAPSNDPMNNRVLIQLGRNNHERTITAFPRPASDNTRTTAANTYGMTHEETSSSTEHELTQLMQSKRSFLYAVETSSSNTYRSSSSEPES